MTRVRGRLLRDVGVWRWRTYNGESREENQGHTDDMDRDINLIVVVGSVLAAAFIQISEGEVERRQ